MKKFISLIILFLCGLGASIAVASNNHSCHGHNQYCSKTTTLTSTSTTTSTTTTIPVPIGSLIFYDEFNGSSIDMTKWDAKQYSGTNIDYYNGFNNISENGGNLIITAAKNSSGIWNTGFLTGKIGYSGARYYEARAKVPCGSGTWAALWEWGYPYGGRPSIENDVIEQLGQEPQAYHSTIHYWPSSGGDISSSKIVSTGITLCNSFHIYGSAVYSDHIDFYLDGKLVTANMVSSAGNLTTWKEVVNVSLNIGGWGGTPTISDPVSFLIDYIHIYSLN